MIIKQIRLSSQAKEKLSRLKGKTGIKNWNILCRWALCYSLYEDTVPTDISINTDSNLEMSCIHLQANTVSYMRHLLGNGVLKKR